MSAFAAKRDQTLEAALVALPSRADAVAEPVLLLHDAAVELVAGNLLGLKDRIAPGLEASKTFVEPPRDAAVEPDGGLGKILQEPPVVADQHHGRAGDLEHRLQALDADHVEMVGGLVEQENVGFRRQHAGERRAPALAARQMRRVLFAAEAEAFQKIARAVRIVARGEPGRDEGRDGGEARQIGALR